MPRKTDFQEFLSNSDLRSHYMYYDLYLYLHIYHISHVSVCVTLILLLFGVHVLTASLPASEGACIMRNVYQQDIYTYADTGKGQRI